jgi:hypothetical protein
MPTVTPELVSDAVANSQPANIYHLARRSRLQQLWEAEQRKLISAMANQSETYFSNGQPVGTFWLESHLKLQSIPSFKRWNNSRMENPSVEVEKERREEIKSERPGKEEPSV